MKGRESTVALSIVYCLLDFIHAVLALGLHCALCKMLLCTFCFVSSLYYTKITLQTNKVKIKNYKL